MLKYYLLQTHSSLESARENFITFFFWNEMLYFEMQIHNLVAF